jgi:transposase-like protein
VRPGRDKLGGEGEVDESYRGGVAPGKHGRGAEKKTIVVIAVEKRGRGMGRVRCARLPDTSADSLLPAIEQLIEPGSVVCTDGHAGYSGAAGAGYLHDRHSLYATGDPAHVAMPRVHRVASLLERWLLGTHQGAVRPQQLDYYLDEFTSASTAAAPTTAGCSSSDCSSRRSRASRGRWPGSSAAAHSAPIRGRRHEGHGSG